LRQDEERASHRVTSTSPKTLPTHRDGPLGIEGTGAPLEEIAEFGESLRATVKVAKSPPGRRTP
jgi:hypothetical protein